MTMTAPRRAGDETLSHVDAWRNDLDRFHLVMDVFDRARLTGEGQRRRLRC